MVQTSKGKCALHFLFCLWYVYVLPTCLFVCLFVCLFSLFFFFFKCVGLHVDCFVKYQWMCFMLYREISTAFKKKLYIQFPHYVSFYMLYSERNTNTRVKFKTKHKPLKVSLDENQMCLSWWDRQWYQQRACLHLKHGCSWNCPQRELKRKWIEQHIFGGEYLGNGKCDLQVGCYSVLHATHTAVVVLWVLSIS